MKKAKTLFRAKKVNEIFSHNVKKSGFNRIKIYSDLIDKMTTFYHKDTEGSFTRTIRVVTEYLSSLENEETHLLNNDLYIKFKLELIKTDELPLFPEYTVRDIDIHIKDYQYLRLILKKQGLLFLDLSDQAILQPDLEGCRTLLHLEKVYIENISRSIELTDKNGELEQDDIIDYLSSFNTLSSFFKAMLRRGAFPGSMMTIFRDIETGNFELNTLLYEKFHLKNSASKWETSYNFRPQISNAALYV